MAASRRKVKRPGLNLAQKLAAILDVYQLSQSALARATHIHQTQISKWVKETGKPDEERMVQISEALGIPFNYLADPRRTEYPSPLNFQREMQIDETIRRIGHEETLDRLLLRRPGEGLGGVTTPRHPHHDTSPGRVIPTSPDVPTYSNIKPAAKKRRRRQA